MSNPTSDLPPAVPLQAKAEPLQAATTAALAPASGNGLDHPSNPQSDRQSNLTQNQFRVWMAQTLVPDAPIYHLPSTLRIRGKIAPKHFQRAFQALIDASDALRTVMEEVDGMPIQQVLPDLTYALELVDFSHLSDKEERAKSWMEERCRVPVNRRERLFDSALIRLSAGEFIWYLNVHHLIWDGWSFDLTYRHMADLYRQSLQGKLPTATTLPPFADYIDYERRHRDTSRYHKAEEYWKQKLKEDTGRISFYGQVPVAGMTRVRRISRDLGSHLTKRLTAAAGSDSSGAEQNSLPAIFTAALAAYLHLIDGKQSYTIGIPFHNRRSKASKETLGFFSEVLPVRVDITGDDTFTSLIRKVREEMFRSARHGQYSIPNPRFQKVYEVAVNYHTHSFRDFAGMAASPGWIHSGHGEEALALHVHDFGPSNPVVLDFELHEAIFNDWQSEQTVRHFLRVLEAFAADPHQPVRRLSLLSPEEARQMLVAWNRGTVTPVDRRCVHELFEEQVRRTPDARALCLNGDTLTYRELNARANRLAHHLRSLGVGPNTPVAISVDPSMEMVIGIYGILKAGGAYVPLDPAYPKERLAYMLEDSKAALLLTQSKFLERLPLMTGLPSSSPSAIRHSQSAIPPPSPVHGLPSSSPSPSAVGGLRSSSQFAIRHSPSAIPTVLCLDTDWPEIARNGDENPPPLAGPYDLIYVIYTSGSTGQPKGAAVYHRGFANLLRWFTSTFEIGATDRALLVSSLSFDLTQKNLYAALIRGGELHLPSATHYDPSRIQRAIAEQRITLVNCTPSAFYPLIEHGKPASYESLRSLRAVFLGGEPISIPHLRPWLESDACRCEVVNTYGPTECTDICASYRMNRQNMDAHAFTPIGRPISNTELLVLDRQLRPCPPGIAGELWVGGNGVGAGYINDPELTAERFLPDSFAQKSGARLYRTGDLARYLPDGNIEFLGRIDHQVKIRGFRIELGEIETVLRKHPLIQDAVVAQDGASTLNPLIAGLVPRESAALNMDEIRAFTAKRLPDYMVPAAFVVLDALPLTPSGKVDRRALSVRVAAQPEPAKPYVPPRTSTEEQIASIWADVLRLERVGRDEHFFALGGHSLLATQLLSRMRREFAVDLPLRAIFEAPTVAGQAERVEEIKSRGKEPDDAIPPAVEPSPNGVPLSFSQTRIWFMEQVAPESAAYNIPAAIRFTGLLDKDALTRTLNELIRRHESLRTTFQDGVEGPVQVVTPELALAIPEIDLRPVPETARLRDAKRLLKEEASRPFDLEQGPLFRVLLLQLAEEDHVLLLNIHHGICDQWSMGIIAREVSSLYNAFRNSLPVPTDPMPVPYADFAISQTQYLTGERLKTELSYWKKQLAGLQPLELPTDRPRPSVQTFHGAHAQFSLSKELIEGLKRLGIDENATLFMVFLTAFKALLMRYSGREDIAVGSPIANRARTEWEGVIGTFINVLVLRTDLSGNPTFRELLRRAREVVLDALAHQEMPFEKLVEELQPRRDTSRSPLVQVLFNFHNPPSGKVDMAGLSWAPFEIDAWASQFDLGVTIDSEITRKIWVSYNTDLYDAATIGRMLSRYASFLAEAVRNPDRPIANIPLATEAERHQLLRRWNDTAERHPHSCVHELVEAQARRTPDAVAVVFPHSGQNGKQRLTYGELNRRADRVAGGLRAMGVGPEVRVGICMERSLDLLIGLLGILKAGGAYVPIDPAYPLDRIAFMVEDSGMQILLTQEHLAAELRRIAPGIVTIDEVEKAAKPKRRKSRARSPRPNHLAYTIYTSGSTGKPKGVEIEHRALANFLHSMRRKIAIGNRDVLLGVTTVSFDIAALELFLPLIVGARLVLASREIASDGRGLREQLESSGATVMQATPATWRMLLEAGWKGSVDFKILCGGDALTPELAKALLERGAVVWNLYGPTETTVWSTAWRVDAGYDRISIGRPIANTQAYVLDRDLEPAPVGVAGELYLGGDGLARGYLNRPDLTAEKFVLHPYSRSAARLYKTGDMARYLPDGNIELLGRIDHQVKIRGFRIEPGEIESLLSQHPAVRETVVVARGEVHIAEGGSRMANGEDANPQSAIRNPQFYDKRLVGYVVPDQDSVPSISELRAFLKGKLPDYMVPSAFVFLDKLPLTPNGKVDRRALPEPDPARPELEQTYVHPRTPVEEILAGIWAEVLSLARVGVHDNFFELGGHSLLATQVISRLRDALQVDIPLRFLFEEPTVAGLAGKVAVARRTTQWPPPAPIVSVPRDGNLPLSFAQQRLWFLNQLEPSSPAYNITGAARFSGPLQVTALEQSLTEILRRHEALRTTFRSIDGLPVQIIAPAEPIPLPVVDLTELSEAEREQAAQQLAVEEAKELFNLARGPLIRAKLLRMGEEKHVLVLVIHHIASDGWSHGVLFREMATLYEAFSTGNPSPLPELPIQYADYAVWQQEWLQGEILEDQLSYWKRQLHGAPPVLELPTDRPRLPVQTFRGTRQSLQLSPALTAALKELSRREGVTLFMTILAAFQTLLHRYTGQDDILVGSPIANRTRAEIEGLIGFFANTLVLRTDLSGNPSFRELLGRVREVALGAYAHQDLPFERLVEELRPERHLSHTPLFQVMFVLQNAPNTALEVPELVISPLEVGSETSKFDLTLSVTEGTEGLKGVVEYSSDLFEAGTVRRMLDHFQTLLENVVTDTEQKILAIPLLTKAESDRLLIHWKGSQADYPKDGCVHRLFEEQAARSPKQVALACGDKQLTYSDLNERANQLARYLRRLGVGPDTLVAISVGRSLEMVVGILGILKAGGSWLPLDPTYPKERLAFMLGDSRVPFLLTEAQMAAALPEHSAKTILLDGEWPLISRQSKANPSNLSSPKDPAYVIYTSGSTGRPNGVMISHESLCHYVHAMGETLGMTTGEVYLHTATMSFSSSVRQLMVPLAHGARVVIASADRMQQPAALFEMIKDEGVTIIDIVPSYWRHCIYELEGLEAQTRKVLLENQLRLVLTASEPLWSDLPRKWAFGLRHPAKTINMFGQTETTGIVATYPVPRRDGKDVKIVPIGRPIADTEIYVLDHQWRPVPVGVAGEIYVGGIGLARGYLNQPELTAERFVPNPFSHVLSEVEGNDAGARLYRTGDVGRYSHDGNIEFIGRTDRQVKIRGFRIELGEIETALVQHPVVREAAVAVHKVASGNPSAPPSKDNQLVGYVVPDRDSVPSTSELRAFLKGKLPEYMIPSAFVMLDALPLTPNGKADRKALPEPDETRPEQEAPFIPPSTWEQKTIAEIWAEVLRVDRVGIHDNFFDLGGHSLLATQVVSRMRTTFHVHLPIRALFENPTVAGLAARIAEALMEAMVVSDEAADMLAELESLSDEEAERLLAQEDPKKI